MSELAIMRCGDCAYLVNDVRPDYAENGHCHRAPPQILAWVGIDGYERPQPNFEQHWPYMQASDWCGLFAKRVDVLSLGSDAPNPDRHTATPADTAS